MAGRCTATTRKAHACRNPALPGLTVCAAHQSNDRSTTEQGSQFEVDVVKILALLGYRVDRNVTLNGCQIDILATYRTGLIELRLMVECKDYAPRRPVGVEDINFSGGAEPTHAIHRPRDLGRRYVPGFDR